MNVLHVSEMNRNLVNGDLLGTPGVKSVYESGKLVLSVNGVFVGNGYSSDKMVKLCIVDNAIIINMLFLLICLILFLYGVVD